MTRWGMAIDLQKCVGCQTCTIACKQANNLPPGVFWRRVVDCETGTYPDVQRTFLPMACMHCENPPCLEVCPSTATQLRAGGIVAIDYDLCVGCGYCVVACPYLARTIITEQAPYFAAGPTLPETYLADPNRTGVCTKCDFCVTSVAAGLAQGLRPGVDFAATPACVGSCIAGALHFGDLDDPESPVSRVVRQHASARLLEDLGTRPAVHYVGTTAGQTTLIPPRRQTVWGWPAVANFTLGGMGAGLYLLGLMLALLPAGGPVYAAAFQLGGPALSGLGLLALTTEAGRPSRALNLFRHLRRSWMSREALAAAIFIPAAAAGWLWPVSFLRLASAMAAVALLVSQGFIVARARGVTAWNVSLMPLLFVTCGLSGGAGLAVLLTIAGSAPLGADLALIALVSALLDLAVWIGYLRRPGAEFASAVRDLRALPGLILIVGAGHLMPVLLLMLATLAPFAGAWAGLAGTMLVVGGVLQKAGIIRKAGNLRAIRLGTGPR